MEQVLLALEGDSIIIKRSAYDKEEELQEILKNNPSLIDLSSVFDTPIMIIGRESEHIDVLAITADAVPIIIECKRKDNPDMRYLIAQVFEYASKLNHKSFREFDEMATKYLTGDRCQEPDYRGLTFKEAFSKFRNNLMDGDTADYDGDFVSSLSEYLENGEFYLLVVVDKISDIAYQTIQFLNRKLHKLRIEIIEVSKFQDGHHKIFVPNHVNREKPASPKSQPGKITFEEMVESCGSKEAGYIKEIRKNWEDQSDFTISMGTKGFSARCLDIPVLYVLPERIRIAPRVKRSYEHLFEPTSKMLKQHFPGAADTSVKYESQGFSLESLQNFLSKLKGFWMDALNAKVQSD